MASEKRDKRAHSSQPVNSYRILEMYRARIAMVLSTISCIHYIGERTHTKTVVGAAMLVKNRCSFLDTNELAHLNKLVQLILIPAAITPRHKLARVAVTHNP